MLNRPLNISFELTDNYTVGGFRNFIKLLLSDSTRYNIFIISNDDSAAYITKVGETLGLPSTNVVVCNFTADKIQAITDNNIDIHLDNLQSFTMLVEETTDAYGILVTKNLNKYYLRPDYIITFDTIALKITNETN
jgi:hypothetical protein